MPAIPANPITERSSARLTVLAKDLKTVKSTVSFCFSPTEYQIQKSNSFADIPIPGLQAPPIQFVRGGGEKLAFELLLDTSQSRKDVRKEYVSKLRALMDVDADYHAPPVLRFEWDQNLFLGVMESLNVTYTLFDKSGMPLRAKAAVALKQYVVPKVLVREPPRNSADVDKAYVVQAGDTLSDIATSAYDDPSKWREIARANGILDPRRLEPGLTLTIPRLTEGPV